METMQVFVYGSLKRGFENHSRYCRGVRSIQRARVAGRLCLLTSGYPALVLEESLIVARGSADLAADLEKFAEIAQGDSGANMTGSDAGSGCCRFVWGELLSFGNPWSRLRALDRLEEFRGRHRSVYERVLVRVRSSTGEQLAWTYVAGERARRQCWISGGRWKRAFGRPLSATWL